jgi:hypothetical protein
LEPGDFTDEQKKALIDGVLPYVARFLQTAAAFTTVKFDSRKHVWIGGPVVAFRVGYVVGVWEATIRSEVKNRGIYFASDAAIRDLSFVGAVVSGWMVFGLEAGGREADVEEFTHLFNLNRPHPAWIKGYQTGFNDVERAMSGTAIGFAPQLALIELENGDTGAPVSRPTTTKSGASKPATGTGTSGEAKTPKTETSTPEPGRTAYDELCRITIGAFRSYATYRGIAPSANTTDEEIISIYEKVCSAFRAVARERNEHLPGVYVTTIVFKFYQLHEDQKLRRFFDAHLEHELNVYRERGLREDYKVDLGIL